MPSTSPKQARTMAAAAHNPAFALKMGIPVKVAKDFNKADTGKHMIHMADGGLHGMFRPQGFPDVSRQEEEAGIGATYPAPSSADVPQTVRQVAAAPEQAPTYTYEQGQAATRAHNQMLEQERQAAQAKPKVRQTVFSDTYAHGGMVRKNMKSGGRVKGPGSGTSDSVPAMLSHGEYVMPADTVRKIGAGKLDAIKNATHNPMGGMTVNSMGGMPHMAGGGLTIMPAYPGAPTYPDDSDTERGAELNRESVQGLKNEAPATAGLSLPSFIPDNRGGYQFATPQDQNKNLGTYSITKGWNDMSPAAPPLENPVTAPAAPAPVVPAAAPVSSKGLVASPTTPVAPTPTTLAGGQSSYTPTTLAGALVENRETQRQSKLQQTDNTNALAAYDAYSMANTRAGQVANQANAPTIAGEYHLRGMQAFAGRSEPHYDPLTGQFLGSYTASGPGAGTYKPYKPPLVEGQTGTDKYGNKLIVRNGAVVPR